MGLGSFPYPWPPVRGAQYPFPFPPAFCETESKAPLSFTVAVCQSHRAWKAIGTEPCVGKEGSVPITTFVKCLRCARLPVLIVHYKTSSPESAFLLSSLSALLNHFLESHSLCIPLLHHRHGSPFGGLKICPYLFYLFKSLPSSLKEHRKCHLLLEALSDCSR